MRFVIVQEHFAGTREYVVKLGDDEAIVNAVTKVKANDLDCEPIGNSLEIRNPEGISYLSREYNDGDKHCLMTARAERLILRDKLETPVVPMTGKEKKRVKVAEVEQKANSSKLTQTMLDLIP